jgi:phage-related protein
MFSVDFYEDNQGRKPIKEVLNTLRDKSKTSKDSRVQYHKILAYIRSLEEYGTRAGEPIVKHIEGNIWELRPLSHRIFFFYWKDNKFILLHHFVKKTNKTPSKEIDQAKRNMQDHKERNE